MPLRIGLWLGVSIRLDYRYDAASDAANALHSGHENAIGSPIEGGAQSPTNDRWATPAQDYFLAATVDQAQ